MPEFGKNSKSRLATCHPDLQRLFNEVIKQVDCTIICGHRNREDQDEAYRTGKSKVQWPDGKHNKNPSEAVDAVPYPIDWADLKQMYMFVGFVRGIALSMGIKIRCGADWNGNFDIKDQNFHDVPHFELVDAKPVVMDSSMP